jgi:hypothetical protein
VAGLNADNSGELGAGRRPWNAYGHTQKITNSAEWEMGKETSLSRHLRPGVLGYSEMNLASTPRIAAGPDGVIAVDDKRFDLNCWQP